MTPDRRRLLKGAAAAGGIGLLAYAVGGATELMTPREAKRRGMPLKALTEAEAALLEAFGEVLLPGAAEAGIAAYVDHQLARPHAESLLMIRYLDVPAPWAPFYKGGLAALDAHARAAAGKPFADLDAGAAAKLVGDIAKAPPFGWRGPPSPLLYFVVRADAVDVVYGTEAGFEKLGVPLMAHLLPETPW